MQFKQIREHIFGNGYLMSPWVEKRHGFTVCQGTRENDGIAHRTEGDINQEKIKAINSKVGGFPRKKLATKIRILGTFPTMQLFKSI